jgi:DNA-binding transcriptional regulator YhcF (GntR family)
MNWKLTEDRPIWIQLVEQLTMLIVSGIYESGSAVPAVRTLATEAGVNPNTMQRALAELENRKLVETRRTAGRIVTEDLSLILSVRKELAYQRTAEFFASMHALGYTEEQTRELLAAWNKKEESV